MAELLVRIVDGPGRPAGEVLVACLGGWRWSKRERTNPRWTVVRVDGLDEATIRKLLAPQPPARPMPPDDIRRRTLCMRAWRLQVMALTPKMSAEALKATITAAPYEVAD